MITQYKMRKAEVLLKKDLLPKIPHQGRKLDVALFGPSTYRNNVSNMLKHYFNSRQLPNITFIPATTAESISVVVYDVAIAKEEILSPKRFPAELVWLQAGSIFQAPEWVVINPPKDKQGDLITDVRILKNYLNRTKKVNGIYMLPNKKIKGVKDCSIVPYESFKQVVQSRNDFVRGGLARGLEYASGDKAPNLEIIVSEENYSEGVEVSGFGLEDEVGVVALYSSVSHGLYEFGVNGYYGYGVINGCAFGVLSKTGLSQFAKK